MKRIIPALLALFSAAAFSATLAPVQLLNPAGSTAGQAIVSTGASSAPAWTTVANAGANTNITSLTGLTTPLGTWAGGLGANNTSANGVPVFSSGAATVTATTGTGSPVLATSPTITTPLVVGVTNGVCASSGKLGECLSTTGSSVALSNGVAGVIASVNLTAGEWLVWGNVEFSPSGATPTILVAGMGTSVAGVGTPYRSVMQGSAIVGVNTQAVMPQIFHETGSATINLYGVATFTGGSMAGSGYISAIRFH